MNRKQKQNHQRGSVHVVLIALLVLSVGGAIGFRFYQASEDRKNSQYAKPTSNNTSDLPTVVQDDEDIAIKAAASTFAEPPKNANETKTEQIAATPSGQIAGKFAQQQNSAWPKNQPIAYIGVVTSPKTEGAEVSKVEWYLDSVLQHTETQAAAKGLYQFNWPIAKLATGWYHWTAKVYDDNGGVQVVRAQDGKPYINMKVTNPGTVGGKFVQKQNTSWLNKQTVAYIGLNVSDASKVSKVEWYLGKVDKANLKYTAHKPSAGTLFQYDWPIADVAKGSYRWRAVVYDTNGLTRLVKNNLGDYYVDMLVKSN